MSTELTGVPQPPDGELAASVLRGEPGAFDQLFDRYQPRLLRWLKHRVDAQTAEDLTQDTLIRALSALDSFDPDRPLWPWLKAIATNLAADHHRTNARQLPSIEHEQACRDAATAPDHDVADLLAERQLLAQALSALPDRQRVAMTLRYLHDWAPADIGKLLDLTRVSTEQLLLRARRRLHDQYTGLTRDKLHAWAWLLLWPYYTLRDRWNRTRDTLASTTPGTAQAATEAALATAAVAAIAITLSFGGLLAPSQSLADSTHEANAAREPAPTTTRHTSTTVTPAAPKPALEPPVGNHAAPHIPPASPSTRVSTGAAPQPAYVQAGIKNDNGERTLVEYEYDTGIPIWNGDNHAARGKVELHCDGPIRTRVCEEVEDLPSQ